MLEKLDSEIKATKLDAAITLTEAISKYPKRSLTPYISTIWCAVKREIEQAMSSEIETAGLELLQQLATCISSWPANATDKLSETLEGFMQDVLESCMPSIRQQRTDKQAWMCCRMLLACVKASRLACVIVVKECVPLLTSEIKESTAEILANPQAAPFMMDRVQTPLNVLVDLIGIVKTRKYSSCGGLDEYKDTLLDVSLLVLTSQISSQIVCTAVACVAACISTDLLTPAQLQVIATTMTDHYYKVNDDAIRKEILLTNGLLAGKYPKVMQAAVLPRLLTTFRGDSGERRLTLEQVLYALSSVCTETDVRKQVVKVIVGKVCSSESSEITRVECLKCLKNITRDCGSPRHLLHTCVMPLIKHTAEQLAERRHLKLVASIIHNYSTKLKPAVDVDRSEAEQLSKIVLSLVIDGDTNGFDIPTATAAGGFDSLMCCVTASVCVYHGDLPVPRRTELHDTILRVYAGCADQPTYVTCCKALASLLNKCTDVKAVDQLVEKVRWKISLTY